ncbi:polysaccharide pyruvyl transferase family protein [Pararhodobacter sp. SW119]|uniref:polysaccharide pyruvyl transferase family protein n=1 Tax=Pararhodobacter sp. SW119 TaxID=2780075 RepID=UPI001ADF1BCD|nr:polysaccharide pyruvyl transferase family protein [Pararhodobacter sp. SW119]
MAGKHFVLMNHTNLQGYHFGCARVMRIIEEGLLSRGGVIAGRIDGRLDWRNDSAALRLLADCDAIVINGEGTLHHGRKRARWLMEVATHEVTRDKELSLINALYQENPDSWAPMLARFRHLYARDKRSATEMSRQAERDVEHLGDLSTSAGAIEPAGLRRGIMIGDSVRSSASMRLAKLAQTLARSETVELIPLTTALHEHNPYRNILSRTLRRHVALLRHAVLQRGLPRPRHLNSEAEYLERLRHARLSITGRFHGICFNLVTATPFVAVSSNSWKIEALFEDARLDPRRLIAQESLTPERILNEDWSFSDTERANISAFIERTGKGAARMFDALTS